MKRLLLSGLLFSQLAFGYNAIVNCASSTLGLLYNTSTPSLQPHLTGLYLRSTPSLMLANPTNFRVCANTVSLASAAPTAGNGNEYCLPAQSIAFFDVAEAPRGPANVFVRADVASCTTGIIDVNIW